MTYIITILVGSIGLVLAYAIPILRLRLVVQLFAAIAIVGGVYFGGVNAERTEWKLKMSAAELQIKELESKSSQITTVVVTEYVPKIRYIDRVEKQIVKEYVTVESDAKCEIQKGFTRLHDSSVQQVIIQPEPSDQDPQNIVLSEVADTIKFNYQACNRNSEKLKQLQSWVKTQEQNWNNK